MSLHMEMIARRILRVYHLGRWINMPVKFVGRITSFKGKRLFDILCRLKNFGRGRIVYRHVFNDRYPEPSYYVISDVFPDMKDPTLKEPSEHMRGSAKGTKVWRGENLGEQDIHSAYKADWRLVPKDQEENFLNYQYEERHRNIIPRTFDLPPLLKYFVETEYKKLGQDLKELPQPERHISRRPHNRAIFDDERHSDMRV